MTADSAIFLAAAGGALERVQARLEWGALPTGMPGVAAVLACAAVAWAVVAGYRREKTARPRVRWLTLGLRLAVLAALAVILMRPSVARDVERTWPGRVVVLADRSASMATADLHLDGAGPQAWADALALAAFETCFTSSPQPNWICIEHEWPPTSTLLA